MLGQAAEARSFFDRQGFVVFTDIMTERENAAVLRNLVADLHEINPSTRHIGDVAGFEESDLPSSPNNSFRTTCNIVFGRFATSVRNHEGVREAFAYLHRVPKEQLGCSWDTIFYSPKAKAVSGSHVTQLHWDANGYSGSKKHAVAEELCVQGVYYGTETNLRTPAFACSPRTHTIWREFSESSRNPARRGEKLINYMPLERFGEEWPASLPLPQRIHVPARSLLLWNSRTLHGNAPRVCAGGDSEVGRASQAICYGPVERRTVAVQKDALLKAIGGVRTTHHPSVMLTHDRQGYPVDWTAEAEYEPKHAQWDGPLRDLEIQHNPKVTEADFHLMLQRSAMCQEEKRRMIETLSLNRLQRQLYRSYWGIDGFREADYYAPLLGLQLSDLRQLVHPKYSRAQGRHPAELASG